MNKTLQTFRFLFRGYSRLTLIGFLVILGNVSLTDLIFYLTGGNLGIHQFVPWNQRVPLTGPFEVTAGIFIFVTSLVPFIPDFKIGLANGISRKTFLLANLPVAAMAAAALSIFSLLVVLVHRLFWPIIFFSSVFYHQINWAWILGFQFTLYFMLAVAGWFFPLIYYRSNAPVKWIITLAPIVLLILIKEMNTLTGGATFEMVREYLSFSMGNPYKATVTFLTYAVILYGVVYLLIRRAPLKD